MHSMDPNEAGPNKFCHPKLVCAQTIWMSLPHWDVLATNQIICLLTSKKNVSSIWDILDVNVMQGLTYTSHFVFITLELECCILCCFAILDEVKVV